MNKKQFFLFGVLTLSSFTLTSQSSIDEIRSFYGQIAEQQMEEYIYLHTNPELSFLEEKTAAFLVNQMTSLGFEVTGNVGGYGVVAVLRNGDGPTVMLRTDTDALPVLEETGAPFASKVRMTDITGDEVPVMHACGHDVHMMSWLGTARVLASMKEAWSGTLMMIAQPAEERAGGAKAMLADNLYSRFGTPDYALALHVNATLPSGKVGYCNGYALANVQMVDIAVFGRGGHGAYPHTAIDPVVIAAKLILDLQTIVSREVNPLEPAVVTVGAINGGTKGNVIPDRVDLMLTLRSYTDEVKEQLVEAIRRRCDAAARAAGLPEDKFPAITIRDEETPAVYNSPELGTELVPALKSAMGEENIIPIGPVMGGEDFSMYGRTDDEVPIYLFWLGAVNFEQYAEAQDSGAPLPPLHSPKFLPDAEPTIAAGVELLSTGALELFRKE